MSAWTVTYRATGADKHSVTVLADTATDAVAAVRALVPVRQVVETRGTHFGLDTVEAEESCRCGHAAKLHTSDPFTGDGCEHYGPGSGDGAAPVSFHGCGCQGFWAAS